MWLLRHFGLLPMILAFFFTFQAQFPVATTGWLAGRSLALHFFPVAVAAWALWVILSAHKQPATESAG